jgi:ubiquitin C-terminal hydrolase
MSKSSSKKRKRLAAKRERELNLANLRGVSLLDSEKAGPVSPHAGENDLLLTTAKTSLNSSDAVESHGAAKSRDVPLSMVIEPVARNRVEFVVPRAQGKAKRYIFDKQAKAQRDEGSAATQDEKNGIRTKRSHESIDEILFPAKKRKHGHTVDALQNGDDARSAKSSSDAARGSDPAARPSSKDSDSQDQRKSGKVAKRKIGEVQVSSPGRISGRSVAEAVSDKQGMRPRANSTDAELMLPQGGLCDERMVLHAHRWDDELNYVHQIAPKGLVNLGNTCFLNATLQCLAYLPPFCQSLVRLSEAKARQANGGNKKQSKGQKVTSFLSSLFQKVHGFGGKSLREGAIAPRAIVQALPSLGSCGSRNGYKFSAGRQEDAHEFLVHLLDAMHDGELRAAGINQHLSGWRDRLPVSRLDETTFIHRIFGGYFRSQVRCGKCGYRSNTYDPFLDLSLEVSKKASNSVLYAISEFTRKETLDSENQWKCSGCKKHVCATKQLTVFRPPLSLCIQLKRFTFDGGFGGRMFNGHGSAGRKFGKHGGGRGSKITKPIEFPADLDLPLSDGRSCAYALTGIVIHVGGSASSGHYTAYVKKPGRKGTDQWYHADDSFVEPVSVKTVLRQKDAYVLFYCRKEVKLEFPSPPPRGMSAEEAKEFGRARAKARADSISAREETKKTLVEDPKTPSGRMKRVSTTVHPLASPGMQAPSTATLTLGEPLSPENMRDAGIVPIDASRNSFPTVSSSQLREYMMKRLSEPPRVLLQKANMPEPAKASIEGEKGGDEESSSSGSDDSSAAGSDASSIDGREKKKMASATDKPASSSSGSESSSDSGTESQVVNPQKVDKAGVSNEDSKLKSSARKDTESNDASSDESSDSSSGSESGSSSDDSDSEEDGERQPEPKPEAQEGSTNKTSKDARRTRVVLADSDSRGKVRVMLGPRRKRSWQSKNIPRLYAKGTGFELLGNRGVTKWDDEENEKQDTKAGAKEGKSSQERKHIVANMEKQERARKRKIHLDRWDSVLDQGKVRRGYLLVA